MSGFTIRQATLDDRVEIERLIERSAREVSTARYTAEQVEGALRSAFGVDTALIEDGTLFVVEDGDGGLIACGGWSRRRKIFGSDQRVGGEQGELDPSIDAARIRTFFVDSRHLRKGIASSLLERCESAAREAGFSRFELMGTLTGVPFYEARGYARGEPVSYEMEPELSIDFVPMAKSD